ncbi:MAG: hypothetical protein GY828_07995, partial [Candidatus Gracilibacteria bacterium]|nr:hypothetical protein [Candidatus Gracilibacteria bacterium]
MSINTPTESNNNNNEGLNKIITNNNELTNKLNAIGGIFDNIEKDNSWFEVGTSKKEIMKTWIGDSVDSIDNQGLIDTQVTELYNKMKAKKSTDVEISKYVGELLTDIHKELSSANIQKDEGDESANRKLNTKISSIENMDEYIFTKYENEKLQKQLTDLNIKSKNQAIHIDTFDKIFNEKFNEVEATVKEETK